MRLRALTRSASRLGLGRAVAFALMIALAALRVVDPAPLEELRLRTFDFFQLAEPREVSLHPAVIVDIDEESLKVLGQWPWPRTVIADLLVLAHRARAAAIGFDVIFAEPDRYSPGSIIDLVPDLDEQSRERIRALPSNDRILADAFRRSKVVLGEFRRGRARHRRRPGKAPDWHRQHGRRSRRLPHRLSGDSFVNIPILEDAATATGMLTIHPERDGIVRRVPLAMRAQGLILSSLSLAYVARRERGGPGDRGGRPVRYPKHRDL